MPELRNEPTTANTGKITPEKFFGHLATVNRHRAFVRKECFRIGLYRQGLLHDLSKYAPAEFLVGARYYTGKESPNNGERRAIGYSSAWLHHKGRNRHHYEYWIDYSLREIPGGFAPVKMPGRFVCEMFCDRVAASKVYLGGSYTDAAPLAYYKKGNTARFLHPETAALLEKLLTMLAEDGEDVTIAYIKRHLHKGKRHG